MSNIHGPGQSGFASSAQSFGPAGSAPRQRVQFEPEQSNEQQLSDEPGTSSSQQLHERTPSPILQPSEQERGITRRLESIVDGFRTGHASKCDAITGIINCISEAKLDGRRETGKEERHIEKKLKDNETCLSQTLNKPSLLSRLGMQSNPQLDQAIEKQHPHELIENEPFVPAPENLKGVEVTTLTQRKGLNTTQISRKLRNAELKKKSYLGLRKRNLLERMSTAAAKKTEGSLSYISKIPLESKEWDKLLRGDLADFDAIYSSIHHVGASRENRGRIRDHEIIFGHSDPIRKIEDHGQWTIAASLYGEALAFAWPNRK
ncbi:hypothetical protein C0992_005459, partial [Termitomyces sp. T32_za158]